MKIHYKKVGRAFMSHLDSIFHNELKKTGPENELVLAPTLHMLDLWICSKVN